ncbi:hypothetical protein PENTCL1PPCAC_9135, partial [Pristionchus entomophagus]
QHHQMDIRGSTRAHPDVYRQYRVLRSSHFMQEYLSACRNPSLYIGSKNYSPQMGCNPTGAEISNISKFTNLHLNNMFIRSDKFVEIILKRYQEKRAGEWHLRTSNSIHDIMNGVLPLGISMVMQSDGTFAISFNGEEIITVKSIESKRSNDYSFALSVKFHS